jgi:hypothetical protein
VIDFVVVLIGYALSGEPTLDAFYEHVLPFASAFMQLFGRQELPQRSTLSRFLAALDAVPVDALRARFFADLLARCVHQEGPGGLWDHPGGHWLVFDVDGTRKTARQRALPQRNDLPVAHRRLVGVCAPGYLGRKRVEVVRTRATVLYAHTHHWLGTFSEADNGDYRGGLLQSVIAIVAYLTVHHLPLNQGIVRLDGQYGIGAIVAAIAFSSSDSSSSSTTSETVEHITAHELVGRDGAHSSVRQLLQLAWKGRSIPNSWSWPMST